MAHLLDRILLTALAVILSYGVTLSRTGSVPLAMLAGAVAPFPALMTVRAVKRFWARTRFATRIRQKKAASQTVRCWAVMREPSCADEMLALLRVSYPESAKALRFPEQAGPRDIPVFVRLSLSPVSEDAVADALCRARQAGCDRAVIAATALFSPEARSLTLLPNQPRTALIDSELLTALIARHPEAMPPRSLPKIRARRKELDRKQALRFLPTALLLLAAYHLFGLRLYLPMGLALLWCALMALHRTAFTELFP